MKEQLPALVILLPLLAAPLALLARRRRPALAIVITATLATFWLAMTLLIEVRTNGTVRYALGGWDQPWGIEYKIDLLSAFVMAFVSGIGTVVAIYLPITTFTELEGRRLYLFSTVYLLCMGGLMGIAATGDLFNLFVFVEISALSTYALVALGRTRRAYLATFQYLIVGSIGATFLLIGIGLLYMITGTLNMEGIGARLDEFGGGRTEQVAFAFLTVGICLKMALFPLHFWLPNAYTYAPSPVSAFIAATSTKVSVYIFIRLVYTIVDPQFAFGQNMLAVVLLPVAIIGSIAASITAIFQTDLKRLLAFSSVAQISYLVAGAALFNKDGLTGSIVHLFNHAITKGALFMAVGAFVFRLGSSRFADLKGVGHRMPVTSAAIVLGGLGLIGIPGTAGFIGKWYLIKGTFEYDRFVTGFMLLIGSLLAVVYVWRFVEVAYFQSPDKDPKESREAPLAILIPTLFMTGLTLVFGFWTDWTATLSSEAAEILLGGGRR